MAEVATRGPMLNPLQFDGGSGDGGSSETTVAIKRNTPSELRGEQLKQKRTMDLLRGNHSVQVPRIPTLQLQVRKILELHNLTAQLKNDKAFKGLAAGVSPGISAPAKSFEGNTNLASAKFCSEFLVPGLHIPLDLTLKTSMRVVSSSSVNWFHRLMSCGILNGIGQFNPKAVWSADQKMTCLSGHSSTSQNSSTETLYYWVYPQCSLPTSVITTLTSSVKGEGQMDFLSKRQFAWETSFRSLYLMLRKNISNIFYVCTRQFVAMFTSGNGSIESTCVCNAYLSQSTRTLRSLLKEQDIFFTMPLCHSKVEQDTAEDLFELSEIERHSMGTSKRTVILSDVDNSPESLLVFSGNNNVHGLYDFLLNYRFLLTSLTTYDVPLLYSPVPFENAALSAPEVKCKEVRRVDSLPVPLKESCTSSELPHRGSDSICYYSIEIKDAYLPPWTIRSICDALVCNGGDFEASFVTEPMAVGLNVVLETEKGTSDGKHASFGIRNTIVSPHLTHAFLRRLKYSDSSYTASLSSV